jgi:hypothetical protein
MLKNIFVAVLILFITIEINSQTAEPVIFKDGLILKLGWTQRAGIITPNPVAAAIELGEWKTPKEENTFVKNDKVVGTWRKITADESFWFKSDSLSNSYVYFNIILLKTK